MRPMLLDELVAYYDGQISADEFSTHLKPISGVLQRGALFVRAAYEYERIELSKYWEQNHWDKLEPMDYYRPFGIVS